MATSGIYNYSRTLNQIASEALELIEAVGDGETLSGNHLQKAKDSLNSLLKEMQTLGLNLWTDTEATLFLTVGQASYDLTTARSGNVASSNRWKYSILFEPRTHKADFF